jgi:hypothetical protein
MIDQIIPFGKTGSQRSMRLNSARWLRYCTKKQEANPPSTSQGCASESGKQKQGRKKSKQTPRLIARSWSGKGFPWSMSGFSFSYYQDQDLAKLLKKTRKSGVLPGFSGINIAITFLLS